MAIDSTFTCEFTPTLSSILKTISSLFLYVVWVDFFIHLFSILISTKLYTIIADLTNDVLQLGIQKIITLRPTKYTYTENFIWISRAISEDFGNKEAREFYL